LWLLGYPEAALADIDYALTDAREIGQVATLMYALGHLTHFFCGNYAASMAQSDELLALADQKGASLLFWKARGMMHRGCVLAMTGKPADAVQVYYFWNSRSALDGSNTECVVLPFAESLCGPQAIR